MITKCATCYKNFELTDVEHKESALGNLIKF